MNNAKKGLIIGGISMSAIAIIGISSLALFTAKTDSDTAAKAEITLTNAQNVNPGDNDPNVPDDANEGTEHSVIYTVSNLGTKSVKTRQTIVITCDEAGKSEKLLDARYLALFKAGAELTKKSYVASTGEEYDSLEAFETSLSSDTEDSVEKETSDNGGTPYIKAIKYIFYADSFDGFGLDIKKGGNAEKEDGFSVVSAASDEENAPVEKEYSFDLALMREANNDYQGTDITVEVLVEAMQYRNTEDVDWEAITKVQRKFSSADMDTLTVPNEDEDKEGNKITINRGGTDKSNSLIDDARSNASNVVAE